MTTTEVANKLVELCRQGKNEEAQETLFADNAQSIEPNDIMAPKVVTGLEAIKAKGIAFQARIKELHSTAISDPIVARNNFAIIYAMDATYKEGGRMTFEEVCVYEVKDGKIILEQFFY